MLVIGGTIWFYRARRQRNKSRHLIDNQEKDSGLTEIDQMNVMSPETNAHTTQSNLENNAAPPIWYHTLFPSWLPFKRAKKALSLNDNRSSSPSVTIDMLDPDETVYRGHMNKVINEMKPN